MKNQNNNESPRINFVISKEDKQKLQIYCINNDKLLSDICREMVEQFIKSNNL